MPLQLRRGSTADRLATTPLVGEIVYDTTTKAVYVGDGTTAGGLPVTAFSVADARTTTAKMFLGDSLSDNSQHSGITFSLVGNRLNATVQQNLTNYIGLIGADQGFKGNLWADDSGLIVNSETKQVYGTFVPEGHIIPDVNEVYNLGSSTRRFKDLYLSGSSLYLGDAVITSTGTAIDFPTGSTVGGQPLGINEGDTYNIVVSGNVIGTDSTVLVNTTNGTFHGDLTGSVFADDSTTLVDARSGVLRGALIGSLTGNVIGNLTGTASSATIASTVTLVPSNSSSSVHYITFTQNSNGDESVRTDTSLTYQPSTNTLALSVLNAATINSTSVSATSVTGTTVFASTIDTADSSAITVIPSVVFNSDVTVENELFIGGDVLPDNSETYSLGSYIRKFNKLYLTEGDNALWIGNATISGNGSIINLPAGSTVGGSAITTAAGSNATTITVNTTGTSADHFISFFDDQTGDNLIYTDDTFKYNPGTGVLTVGDATIGTVTGNLVGNVTGSTNGTHTGPVFGDVKGSVFADDSTILVDGVAGVLRGELIGNVTGNVTGDVVGNVTGSLSSIAVTIGGTTTQGQIRTFSNTDSNIPLLSETFHNTASSNNHWRWERSRGTVSVPTAVQANDVIGSIRFAGYNGSAQSVAAILRTEVGGISGSNVAGAFRFLTTDTSGTSATAMLIGATRNVTIPAGSLSVNQSITAGDGFNTGFLRVADNKISTSTTNTDIELDPNGTGTVDFVVAQQSTVGAAGVASALPATPSTYFKIKVNGVEYVVPAYAVS
jgi:hypothetical protein